MSKLAYYRDMWAPLDLLSIDENICLNKPMSGCNSSEVKELALTDWDDVNKDISIKNSGDKYVPDSEANGKFSQTINSSENEATDNSPFL